MAIKCGSHNCSHNDNDGNCYAKVVNVRGERARITDETLCNSFVDEKLNSMTEFAEEFNAARKKATADNIKCGAHRCKHNESSDCQANNVQINHETASCETFIIE